MWLKFQQYIHLNGNQVSNTWFFDTGKPWETVWISAGVHGNEPAWVEALNHFKLQVEKGTIPIYKWKIILILKWNELALKKNVRFVEDDLNRVVHWVPSKVIKNNYEQTRGKEIKELIDTQKPSKWLDLHTVSSPRAKPYLFSWIEWYNECAQSLGIQNIAVDWANLSKNNAGKPIYQWLSDYINFKWGYWFTFEAWNHNSPEWAVNSYQSIINFLVTLGMTKWRKVYQNMNQWDTKEFSFSDTNWVQSIWDEEQSNHVHMKYKHTFTGWFEYEKWIPYSFTQYKKWDTIWYDILENCDRIEVKAKIDWYIVLPKDPSICEIWKEVFFYWKSI